jgi:hypothetical protein
MPGENNILKRLEEYRQKKYRKRKYMLAIVIFLLILVIGVVEVDYSINKLISGENHSSMISVKQTAVNNYEIFILNKPLKIDTTYIKRDFAKLRQAFSGE